MAKNSNLRAAKAAKNDEFYTQITDIEKELSNYKDFFKGKVVYCNCDDARESNFFKYFSKNFEFLGLKKLITTGYKAEGKGVVLVYEGDKNGNHKVEDSEIIVRELEGSGDFRSEECVEFLKEADVGHEDCAVNIVAAIAVDDAADFRDGIFNIDELCQQRVFLGIGHYFVGDDADEHAPVVHHGGKVLLHGGFQQVLNVHGGHQRLVILAVGDAFQRCFVHIGKAVFQPADAPQQVALGDRAHILPGAADDGDGGVPDPLHHLQRLADGKIFIQIGYFLFRGEEEQDIHTGSFLRKCADRVNSFTISAYHIPMRNTRKEP